MPYGRITFGTALLGWRPLRLTIAWSEVRRYYPFVRTINGIPSESEIRIAFDRAGGARDCEVGVPTIYFSESRDAIMHKIGEATEPR